MRPGFLDDDLEERRCGRWIDLLAGGDQSSGRPFAVAAVGARHMIGDRGAAAPVGRPGVAGDPLVPCGRPRRSCRRYGHRTSSRIRGKGWNTNDRRSRRDNREDAATLPARKDVGLVRQRPQLGAIDLGEQFGPAGAKAAHLSGVEFDDETADGGTELRQGKAAAGCAGRARIQRRAIWTATSTLALSFFGRPGRAARIAGKPQWPAISA